MKASTADKIVLLAFAACAGMGLRAAENGAIFTGIASAIGLVFAASYAVVRVRSSLDRKAIHK